MNKLILLLALVSHSALSATILEPGSSIEIHCSVADIPVIEAPATVSVELSWPESTSDPAEVSHYQVMINNTSYTTPSYPWQGDLLPGNHIVSSAVVGTNGKVSGFTVKSLIIVIGE